MPVGGRQLKSVVDSPLVSNLGSRHRPGRPGQEGPLLMACSCTD